MPASSSHAVSSIPMRLPNQTLWLWAALFVKPSRIAPSFLVLQSTEVRFPNIQAAYRARKGSGVATNKQTSSRWQLAGPMMIFPRGRQAADSVEWFEARLFGAMLLLAGVAEKLALALELGRISYGCMKAARQVSHQGQKEVPATG
ncbi:hypothetical protein G7046_g8757 [Stylonectria norvegica]|nr:hypothetical protein G7046_g8757 [Stylonectria norvegica]